MKVPPGWCHRVCISLLLPRRHWNVSHLAVTPETASGTATIREARCGLRKWMTHVLKDSRGKLASNSNRNPLGYRVPVSDDWTFIDTGTMLQLQRCLGFSANKIQILLVLARHRSHSPAFSDDSPRVRNSPLFVLYNQTNNEHFHTGC